MYENLMKVGSDTLHVQALLMFAMSVFLVMRRIALATRKDQRKVDASRDMAAAALLFIMGMVAILVASSDSAFSRLFRSFSAGILMISIALFFSGP